MSENQDWLNSLKAGDEVMIPSRYSAPSIVKVDRVTATQIIVGGSRYRRNSGYRVGNSSWDFSYISAPTQKGREAAEAQSLRSRLVALIQNPETTLETLRVLNDSVRRAEP